MKTPKRVAIIHTFFVLFAIALIGRAAGEKPALQA